MWNVQIAPNSADLFLFIETPKAFGLHLPAISSPTPFRIASLWPPYLSCDTFGKVFAIPNVNSYPVAKITTSPILEPKPFDVTVVLQLDLAVYNKLACTDIYSHEHCQ